MREELKKIVWISEIFLVLVVIVLGVKLVSKFLIQTETTTSISIRAEERR